MFNPSLWRTGPLTASVLVRESVICRELPSFLSDTDEVKESVPKEIFRKRMGWERKGDGTEGGRTVKEEQERGGRERRGKKRGFHFLVQLR